MIKKVKDSTGQIKWQVRAYENGRGSKRIKRTFERKIDAEAFWLEFQNKVSTRKLSPQGLKNFDDKTLESEATLWLEDAEHRFSPGHMVRCKALLEKEVLPKYGKTPLEMVTPDFMTRYQQSELKKGLLPPTVNRKTEILMAILNFSLKQQRIPYHPALGFRKIRHAKQEMLFWNQDEAVSFLKFTNLKYPKDSPKRWIYVAYLLVLNTAVRAGEVWALRPMDIGNDGKILYVRRQFNRVSNSFGPTKGKKIRLVPCNPELYEELNELIAKKEIGKEETIFQNDEGRPICHDNFTDRIFEKDMKAWGGRRIRFHDMRHSATTLMIASGVDIKTVKEICGHTDIATTMGYVHLVGGAIEKVHQIFKLTAAQGGEQKN